MTGGAGFIGSHLVERLVMDGSNVVVLDDLGTHVINATGTLAVLVAAKAAGVRRFVYASSSSA